MSKKFLLPIIILILLIIFFFPSSYSYTQKLKQKNDNFPCIIPPTGQSCGCLGISAFPNCQNKGCYQSCQNLCFGIQTCTPSKNIIKFKIDFLSSLFSSKESDFDKYCRECRQQNPHCFSCCDRDGQICR